MSELEQNDQRRTSWTQRMEDVSELEQGLERRLQQCAEHQEEVSDETGVKGIIVPWNHSPPPPLTYTE